MNITKKKIDLYHLRDPDGRKPWADIAIDSGFAKSNGHLRNWFRISISSDYGDWTYFWSHPGACWRKFLAKISMAYAAGKFGCDRWFDLEATDRWMKYDIVQRRRQGDCTKQEARDAWEALQAACDDCCDNARTYQEILANDRRWHGIWCGDWADALTVRFDTDPSFKSFWETTWQDFIGQLQAELAEPEAA